MRKRGWGGVSRGKESLSKTNPYFSIPQACADASSCTQKQQPRVGVLLAKAICNNQKVGGNNIV